ncbi:MAG: SpoIID/LytB domain-containing protein [candidate division KSB1 bacterium]|nr:SpoIID/LytB domain-containing protein [candidate division KSB1 bacterium]
MEIRVGIVQNQASVDFATADAFRIVDASGRVLLDKGKPRSVWRATVENGRPASPVFLLVVQTTKDRVAAERLLAELRAKGLDVVLDVLGKKVEVAGKLLRDYRSYRVRLNRVFSSRQEAEKGQSAVRGTWTTIVQEPGQPEGVLVLTEPATGLTLRSKLPVRVEGSRVAIKGVVVGKGYVYERQENRLFRGAMVFMVDRWGKVTAVNVVSLDDYLRSVVPSEMSGEFPLEALKAQAVAARTMVLYTMGSRHPDDPFEVCADVHCQVYGGITAEKDRSTEAVRATAGEVLTYKGQLCEAVYSSLCGGHTESNEHVWQGPAQPYLRGVVETEEGAAYAGRYDLSREEVVRRWIAARPPVFCNVGEESVPTGFGYAKDSFRWDLRVSADELRRTVTSATGQDPGQVLELVPLERGVSGRLVRLQVRGTLRTVTVARELTIRKALADPPLRSSCVVFDREEGPGGQAVFRIRGAGSGHGVGMCQTGAAMMALRHGKDYRQILNHYFAGADITRLY